MILRYFRDILTYHRWCLLWRSSLLQLADNLFASNQLLHHFPQALLFGLQKNNPQCIFWAEELIARHMASHESSVSYRCRAKAILSFYMEDELRHRIVSLFADILQEIMEESEPVINE